MYKLNNVSLYMRYNCIVVLGGILKKVARSLDSVPENGEPPMLQRRDTGDDIPTEVNDYP